MDSFLSVFLVGLFASVGHCVAMCGGVVGALTIGLDESIKTNKFKIVQYHLFYNLGRILSYTFVGILFGALGEWGSSLLEMSTFDKVLRLFSGILMVLMGLYLSGWWFGLRKIEIIGVKIWAKIQPITQKILPITTLKKAFSLGLLWGYLPCGVVYSVLVFAMVSGSWWQGGLIMLVFALGTLPSLLLMGSISSAFNRFNQKPMVKKMAGLLVIIMGVLALWMPLKLLWMH